MTWKKILQLWHKPYGYATVLRVGTPLVISMGSTTLMLFTDRVFLGRYSMNAIAAAAPAGAISFAFLAFFSGVVSYAGVFIAQYAGARLTRQIGRTLWQALYIALFSGTLLALSSGLGTYLFDLVGHAPEVKELEVVYFRILMLGGIAHVIYDALAAYFFGLGTTKPIMLVGICGALLNIPLDYIMINGWFIMPEMGVAGAAYATIISKVYACILLAALIFRQKHETAHKVISQWRFNPKLLKRVLRFGLPSGIHMAADVMAFSFFLMILGRLGRIELAVSNIAFSINSLVFMPMIGLSIATSTLVGQAIGRGTPDDGITATRSALHMTILYMGLMALVLLLFPKPFLRLFIANDITPDEIAAVLGKGSVLLYFVAAYSLPDTMNVIYSGALRGAGDVRFVTWTIAIFSFMGMVLPSWIAVNYFNAGLYIVWTIITVYICILALIFYYRFQMGHWKSMRVIERKGSA